MLGRVWVEYFVLKTYKARIYLMHHLASDSIILYIKATGWLYNIKKITVLKDEIYGSIEIPINAS